MLKTFENTDHLEIMREALLLVGFEVVRDTFLAELSTSPNFTLEQKIAIRLAGATLRYLGPSPTGANQLLLDILFFTWQDAGLSGDDVLALTDAQREGIIEGIMSVCRSIIGRESARLGSLSLTPTSLPEDWNAPEEDPEDPETDPEEDSEDPEDPEEDLLEEDPETDPEADPETDPEDSEEDSEDPEDPETDPETDPELDPETDPEADPETDPEEDEESSGDDSP